MSILKHIFVTVSETCFNPKSIGVEYSLIVLGGNGNGDKIGHVSVLTSLFVKVFYMTKAVLIRDIIY